MQVVARDQRFPNEKSSQTPVTVFVTRTQNPPFFLNTPYGGSLSENDPIGTVVETVTAEDTDLEVGLCRPKDKLITVKKVIADQKINSLL